MDHRGTHLLVDLYGCKREPRSNGALLEGIARALGFEILKRCDHRFGEGGGETAVRLLSTSHISAHTWPEKKYVAFDLFSCRRLSKKEMEIVIRTLKKVYGCRRHTATEVRRGTGGPRR